MKLKTHEDFKVISGDDEGITLQGVMHPLHDQLPIGFCMGKMILDPQAVSSRQRIGVDIVYYVLAGCGSVDVSGHQARLEADNALYVPAHALRYFENGGMKQLIVLGILNEAWREEFDEAV